MKAKIIFLPCDELPAPDPARQVKEEAIRRQLPASEVNFHNGNLMLSRTGVLHMLDEIIAGRTVGNVAVATAMKADFLKNFPAPNANNTPH